MKKHENEEHYHVSINLMNTFMYCVVQFTGKPIVVYPNSGEVWDGRAKRWLVSISWAIMTLLISIYQSSNWETSTTRTCLYFFCQPSKCFDDDKFEVFATRWRDSGAQLIGGCCRTTPATVKAVAKALSRKDQICNNHNIWSSIYAVSVWLYVLCSSFIPFSQQLWIIFLEAK